MVTVDRFRESTVSAAPWERQPAKSRLAYSAFCIYRDLPPRRRSLDKAWGAYRASLGRPQTRAPGRWESWYRQWRWRQRAETWDREQERLVLDGVVRLKANEVETELQTAQRLRARADELVAREGVTVHTLPAVVSADAEATRQARLALGMPTQFRRQDVEIKRGLELALEAQRKLISLVREVLCRECYDRAERAVREVIERQEEAFALASSYAP